MLSVTLPAAVELNPKFTFFAVSVSEREAALDESIPLTTILDALRVPAVEIELAVTDPDVMMLPDVDTPPEPAFTPPAVAVEKDEAETTPVEVIAPDTIKALVIELVTGPNAAKAVPTSVPLCLVLNIWNSPTAELPVFTTLAARCSKRMLNWELEVRLR